MSLTLSFTDPRATSLTLSGGKGASLAKSAQNLPVPGGFIVPATAYTEFIAPLQSRITTLIDADDVDHSAEAIGRLIRDTPVPETWLEAIDEAVAETGLTGQAVAVRSSGTMEDLPGAAFAGQHDTYLGVRGTTSIAEAVRDCYASLWNPHAFRYRRQLGVDHNEAQMAVVVQLMVPVGADDAAGVAFSVDPVRGSTSEVLINAAFGLGETVVGGEEPVDEYRVSRTTGETVATEIATKPRALVMTEPAGGGDHGDGSADLGTGASPGATPAHGGPRTTTVHLGEDQQSTPALTPEQQKQVAELAVAAEEHFGFPQDIEWALTGDQLFLLQSRPITRVAARWTRDESAERFPTPVTPLTWDLCEAGFHASLNHSFDLMGLPPFGDKWFVMRDFYIYGNQTAVELYAGRLPTSMLSSVETITAALPEIARQFGWVQELPVQWMRDLDTYLIGIGRLSNEPLETKTLGQVWDHVIEISDLGTAYFLPNIAISLTQRTLYAALGHMLELALDKEQARVVFERLLASTETKTSQVNAELWDLSRLVRADGQLLAALRANPGEAGPAVLAEFPTFAGAFETFLAQHGHRELDLDAYHPTWVEVPHIVLDQIRLLAEREERAETELERKIVQAETELAVVNAAPEKLRYLVQEVIRLARAYTALDDLEHYQTTRLTLPMRRALRELGARLVDHRILAEAMDVFFIPFAVLDETIREAEGLDTDDALGAVRLPGEVNVDADSTAPSVTEVLARLTPIAEANKAAYRSAVTTTPDWEYGRTVEAAADEDVIRGTAGSPGEIEGEVFVVHSPDDFSSFPDGAILVARTTNPAWTALFYQASGVITESGGALSHGAVTARELGLPAVMAVRDATSRFTSGQRVRINGGAGTVTEL